eukprot:TRINITY_DN11722_c0_g1_i5.p2 TRINITY_DN11722_c0_g1~~TRINITY_DN11722_c0_g1_i5.p2  ORF type:complete len:124 (+),score=26.11 TRINITY_DN11722_c0_g1_i5:103-474(+)
MLRSLVGSEMCIRDRCKECGGSSFCQHGRRRARCKECSPHLVCSHGRLRSQCKPCRIQSTCEHGRPQSRCIQCKQSNHTIGPPIQHVEVSQPAAESSKHAMSKGEQGCHEEAMLALVKLMQNA